MSAVTVLVLALIAGSMVVVAAVEVREHRQRRRTPRCGHEVLSRNCRLSDEAALFDQDRQP